MIRNILSAIAGLVVAWILFTAIQAGGHYMIPPEIDLDLADPYSVRAYMASLTPAMFAVVLAGYAVGSFGAGLVIGKIAESTSNAIPIIVGAILTLGWVMNLIWLPHPMWVAILGFFMFIPFTILGKSITAGAGAASSEEGSGGESEELDDPEAEAEPSTDEEE